METSGGVIPNTLDLEEISYPWLHYLGSFFVFQQQSDRYSLKKGTALVVTGILNAVVMGRSFQANCRNLKWVSVCS